MYQTAFCVLGILIARASGEPLEVALRERIFEPLGMTDTGFSVPADKLDRLAPCYRVGPDAGALELLDGVHDSQWSRPPAFPNAEGGLVSTADDYLAFARMLLNHGRHGSERILAAASVEAMTTNQLTPEQRVTARAFLGDHGGWGFGLSTVLTAGPRRYGWDGGRGTSWASDPATEVIALLMTQRLPPASDVYDDFWTSVSEAA